MQVFVQFFCAWRAEVNAKDGTWSLWSSVTTGLLPLTPRNNEHALIYTHVNCGNLDIFIAVDVCLF